MAGSSASEGITLESLEYTPLDAKLDEVRILILEPHHGNKESPLKGKLEIRPMSDHGGYTAVIHTRGNPASQVGIILNGQVRAITETLYIYLEEIRLQDNPLRLWFRDICINLFDEEEKARCWNPAFRNYMSLHATEVVDMSVLMGNLWDQGLLPSLYSKRQKDWWPQREQSWPKHHPIPLGGLNGPDSDPLPHEYLPLDYFAEEIRLVMLEGAEDPAAPLVAYLAYIPLHGDAVYQCLSYSWGNEEPSCKILLSGQIFYIRKNLDNALRAIRRKEKKHRSPFWIDAICINQRDIKERNRQIPRMKDIFEGAEIVLSWVGQPEEDSDIAMALIPKLRMVPPSWDEEVGWDIGEQREDIGEKQDLPQKLAALYSFLLRPYFRRTWMIQEIALASRPIICCGEKSVCWEDVDNAAYNLLYILENDSEMAGKMMESSPYIAKTDLNDLSFVRKLYYFRHIQMGGRQQYWTNEWQNISPDSPSFLDIAILGRNFDSTLSQDKIFSIWGMVKHEKAELKPDYSRTMAETYVDFLKFFAKHTRSIDIICAAEPPQDDALPLPSWCPDWSQPSNVSSLIRREKIPVHNMKWAKDIGGPLYCAGGNYVCEDSFHFDEQALVCTYVILDIVNIIGPCAPQEGNIVVSSTFLEWMGLVDSYSTAYGEVSNNKLAALRSMIDGDSVGSWECREFRTDSPIHFEDSQTALQFTRLRRKERHKDLRDNLYTDEDVTDVITRGRRLIVTEDGWMGLAPEYVEKGDKLCIINGCSTPIALRETDVEDMYRFCGSVFVQGWMEGEALRSYGETDEEAWQSIANFEKVRLC